MTSVTDTVDMKALLTNLRGEVFHHSSYSQDLARSDFYLFPGSKKLLREGHFYIYMLSYVKWCDIF